MVRAVWQAGRLSRSQLRGLTGLTPNGVGVVADGLVRHGLLRECPPEPGAGAGRPRVPLEIDPTTTHAVGLAIGPGRVEVGRVGFGGVPVSRPVARQVSDPGRLVDAAAALLASAVGRQTLGVGVSVTGFVDPVDRAILFSSAQPGRGRVSLAPVFAAAGPLPVVLENDMHALAARWLLGRRAAAAAAEDVLLVSVADGRLGAAMLIDGRPNRGCATGANELGHARFFVDTKPCYCGRVGCLERIVSTDFLARRDAARRPRSRGLPASDPGLRRTSDTGLASLAERASGYGRTAVPDASLDELLNYLACGIANAVNFVRPHQVIIVNQISEGPAFAAALVRSVRSWLLPELADRVNLNVAGEPVAGSAESAAWLAIAETLHGGWGRVEAAVVRPRRGSAGRIRALF